MLWTMRHKTQLVCFGTLGAVFKGFIGVTMAVVGSVRFALRETVRSSLICEKSFSGQLPLLPMYGQVLYGSLTGNVTDPSGGSIPNAKVEVSSIATGVSKQIAADSRGIYLINDLQAGSYKVTISAPSFGTVIQDNVRLDANTVRRVDAQLQPSQVNQSITVDASAITLQADRADVNNQITPKQIVDLPLGGGRNFQSLDKLTPGSSPPVGAHSAAGNPQGALATNVNGASYNNNLTRIDGTSDLYPWLPEMIAYVPPAEAIGAVNIVTASFDARQGMAGGSRRSTSPSNPALTNFMAQPGNTTPSAP